jgi:histidinol-phosphate aminotransferase
MEPYPSARKLTQGQQIKIFLDANELSIEPFEGAIGLNRYPEQQPISIVKALAGLYGVQEDEIIITRGADEAIDLIIRVFCDARRDNIVICPPTFPVYAFSARVQGVGIKSIPLKSDNFEFDDVGVLANVDSHTKIVFVCTPNNPTGSSVNVKQIENLCRELNPSTLVVVDEAYIEFSSHESAVSLRHKYPNLAILRTLSKSYALAGERCGSLIANASMIELCRRILQIYPLPVSTIQNVLKTLEPANKARIDKARQDIINRRDKLFLDFQNLSCVVRISPTDANFFLVKFRDADSVMKKCALHGIALRNQSKAPGLDQCIRIGIGSQTEMDSLFSVLRGDLA